MRQMSCRNDSRRRSWLVLAAVMLVTVVVWGALLPHMAATESFRQQREALEQHGVNPAAVFYTDHPRWGEG